VNVDRPVRLVPWARLKADRVRGGDVLLYPEKALYLNPTAAAIVRLCGTGLGAGAIAARIGVGTDEALAFLGELAQRGLLEEDPP